MIADLAGKAAAPRAVAGTDVIPWRPASGVYLVIERGHAPADELVELPGVAGVWTYHGTPSPDPWENDATGLQVTYCYLDDDPVAAAGPLGGALQERWGSGATEALLAAPFHTIVPFDWARFLPGG